jgi:Transposase DDE domain
MFVRVKKIGRYEYLYLVENIREDGRHVQRVVKALGRRDEVENSDLLDGLIASAARHSRRAIVLSSFYRGELAELHRHSIGPDLVFGHLWRETGCQAVLRRHLAGRRFGFDVERTIYLTVLHRLMVSGSDRHASTWQQTIEIPGVENLTLNHAYKAMAWLGEAIEGDDRGQPRHGTDAIEEALYQHRKSLFGALSVAFFDTTSLYFEGDGGATLGQRGHSKDFRPQLPQVVLGIVLDERDRPIASFLWPGNTADVTALLPVVARLRSRFGVERACVVADRGMISTTTIAALEAQKIDYILGARERSTKEVRETVLHDDGATVPLTIPRQRGETDLAVKEVKIEGRRNEEEARKDAEARATLLAGLQRKLAGGAKSLVANTGYRRFLAAPEGDGFAIDPAKVEADAQFDGVFVLRTSLSMSALAVVLRYRNLLAVEQSFLAAKTLLATRPIFHRTDAAIRGHIFCTFLALVLRKELLDRLAASDAGMPEWHCIVDDLLDLSAVEVDQDGRRALLRTAPRPSIDPICRALGITLPPVFQEVPTEKASQSAD